MRREANLIMTGVLVMLIAGACWLGFTELLDRWKASQNRIKIDSVRVE